MILQKTLKGTWVVLHRIKVSTRCGIDEGTVATCGYISPTNHEEQTIGARRKEFLIEHWKSIQSPKFFFNVKYNMIIGKRIY